MTLPRARPSPPRRAAGRALPVAAGAAALLHAGAIWLLVGGMPGPAPEIPASFEVELVDQAAKAAGDASPAPAPDQATPAPDVPPPPPPPQAGAEWPPRLSPPRQPAQAAAQSSVNLSADDRDQDSLSVRGEHVVPPRPDALFHNEPPHYPAEAVRRHAEGTVALLVHVTEAGVPSGIDVVGSSGDASLDRSARDAVALWRFQPARDGGVPVAVDLGLSFHFTIGRQARALP